MLGLSPVVTVVIIANILFSMKGFKDLEFFNKFKFHIGCIKAGEKIRLVSSGFLHADYHHLFVNMFTLYFFGDQVVYRLGAVMFIVVYMVSLLLGNYLSFKFNNNQNNYSAVGASGAVSGIVYSAVLLYPNMKMALLIIPIPLPGYMFAAGYMLYTLYGMKKQQDDIGHTAHFGGSVAGLLATIVILPSVIVESSFTLLILAGIIAVGGYLFYNNKNLFNN
tara:strand:- start:6288 stop:6950 length:663 start_codon:yes stop_codon:yes gene_type:complete